LEQHRLQQLFVAQRAVVHERPEPFEPLGVVARVFLFIAQRRFELVDLQLLGKRRCENFEIGEIGRAESVSAGVGDANVSE